MEQEMKQALSMPVIAHEAAEERNDRKNRRLWITVMALMGIIGVLIGERIYEGNTH